MTDDHVFRHDRLLETVVEVLVRAESADLAADVDRAVIEEVERLELMFNAFDESSELCSWRRGDVTSVSPEFATVMNAATEWMSCSGGCFNPLVGELAALWLQAESAGKPPSEAELAAAADAIRTPRVRVQDGMPVATGDCSALNLNAIAKGFIVDRSLDAGASLGAERVCVNAGGDLAHRGDGTLRVGVEDPHRPYDNQPPLAVIGLNNAALATSGNARRGFRVGSTWFGHVIDPRSGWPADRIASVSVVAPDAMTADVLATVAGVMAPGDAVEYLDEFPGVAGLVIDSERQRWATTGWGSSNLRSGELKGTDDAERAGQNGEMVYLDPTPETARALISRGIEGPIVMLNLLRFRETADYRENPELAPPRDISGAEAYRRYAEHTMPHLLASGGEVLFEGEGGHYFIGPVDERWDHVLLIRQASMRDFFAFASNEGYLAGLGHRTAALEDSRLLPLVAH